MQDRERRVQKLQFPLDETRENSFQRKRNENCHRELVFSEDSIIGKEPIRPCVQRDNAFAFFLFVANFCCHLFSFSRCFCASVLAVVGVGPAKTCFAPPRDHFFLGAF